MVELGPGIPRQRDGEAALSNGERDQMERRRRAADLEEAAPMSLTEMGGWERAELEAKKATRDPEPDD
jgi:hypothetical protein